MYMNLSTEYIVSGIGVVLFLASIAISIYAARRLGAKQKAESEEQVRFMLPPESYHSPVVQPAELAKEPVTTAVKPSPTFDPLKSNKWTLEVNGSVKFDIKVTWNDHATFIYSGTAPKKYTMVRPKGALPTNTAGIPPEWADDGISYQWYLNDYHWS